MNDELLRTLRSLDVVYRGEITLKHAGQSDVYADIRKAYGSPVARRLITDAFAAQIDSRTTCIAGQGYGGISAATMLADKLQKYLALIRNEPKKYGTMALIDGYVPTAQDCVSIVDDVLTSGKSLRHMIAVLRQTGACILGCHVVVNRDRNFHLDVPLSQIFFLEDLIGDAK